VRTKGRCRQGLTLFQLLYRARRHAIHHNQRQLGSTGRQAAPARFRRIIVGNVEALDLVAERQEGPVRCGMRLLELHRRRQRGGLARFSMLLRCKVPSEQKARCGASCQANCTLRCCGRQSTFNQRNAMVGPRLSACHAKGCCGCQPTQLPCIMPTWNENARAATASNRPPSRRVAPHGCPEYLTRPAGNDGSRTSSPIGSDRVFEPPRASAFFSSLRSSTPVPSSTLCGILDRTTVGSRTALHCWLANKAALAQLI
jgi:hypothetical protein